MKRLILIMTCLFLLVGCTNSNTKDNDYETELKTYDDRITSLEMALDSTNNALEEITGTLADLEQELILSTREIEDLVLQIESFTSAQAEDDEITDEATVSDDRTLFQVQDDIPISPYTLAELTEIHQTVEDGADLNMYGAAVTQKYFELGISTFIRDIADLRDEDTKEMVAMVFVYTIVSFRDIYYVGDITFEAVQVYLESLFRDQLTMGLSESEEAVIGMILDQIQATYEWYN